MKFGAKTMERLEASIFVTETTSTAVNICRNLFIKFEKICQKWSKSVKIVTSVKFVTETMSWVMNIYRNLIKKSQ